MNKAIDTPWVQSTVEIVLHKHLSRLFLLETNPLKISNSNPFVVYISKLCLCLFSVCVCVHVLETDRQRERDTGCICWCIVHGWACYCCCTVLAFLSFFPLYSRGSHLISISLLLLLFNKNKENPFILSPATFSFRGPWCSGAHGVQGPMVFRGTWCSGAHGVQRPMVFRGTKHLQVHGNVTQLVFPLSTSPTSTVAVKNYKPQILQS